MGMKQRKGKMSMRKRWGRKVIACLTAAAMIGTMFPQSADFIGKGVQAEEVKEENVAEEKITLTDAQVESIYADTFMSNHERTSPRVSVHDPSIVVGYEADGKVYGEDAAGRKKVYYIFGSHRAWAYSYDLVNWQIFNNNINTDAYTELLKEGFAWSAQGSNNYDPSGNMWAPDVIWNEAMGKWCMYMSVNGPTWNSSIALLTSDSLNGDWTYVDTVVYSGFTASGNNKFTETDYTEVTGEETLPERFKSSENGANPEITWNHRYGAHAIDPCVFYDEEGKLWMSYGSWSGGIWMFQLDETTGLRDQSIKYEYVDGETDPYMGYKLAGGSHRSGEASYIEYIDGKYYLFVTYGGLEANGGYNMRVFSSENVTGPYVDLSGDDARYPQSGNAGASDRTVGTRLMSYYRWNHMNIGFAAQGHNSAFVDTDGKKYLIYHTRFDNGMGVHEVRVHQLFTGEHGEIVAAPFEYAGEALQENGYAKEDVTGTYQVLYHTSSINYSNLECVKEQTITLNGDGTVTGDYPGTWEMKDGKPYVTLTTGNVSYSGVFVEQEMEETDVNTMCFTVAGTNDVTIWGYKIPSDDVVVAINAKTFASIPESTYGDVELPSAESLSWGAQISWASSNPNVLSDTGVVTTPTMDTEVLLTATISKGSYQYQKTYKITVRGDAEEKYDSALDAYLVASYFENNPQPLKEHVSGDLSFDNPYNENISNALDVSDGVMIQFDISDMEQINVLGTILGFGGSGGKLYFTQGSYLGYNALGGYFDANLKNYGLVKDYIGEGGTVRIKLTSGGFTVWVNDNLAYTESIIGGENGAGDLRNYGNVLTWLKQTADRVYLGYGGWWTDTANCSISNIKFYVCRQENHGTGTNPNDAGTGSEGTAESSGVLYGQNYEDEGTALSGWNSTNASGNIRTGTGNEFGTYFDFSPKASGGSRGAAVNFDLDESDFEEDYILETDAYLNPSTNNNSGAQLAFTTSTQSYPSRNMNNGLNSNSAILKLATDSGNTTWKINDTEETVILPKDAWIHIKAKVDVSEKTAHIIFTGKELLVEKDVAIPADSMAFGGLYILASRASGEMRLDNTYVYRTEMAESDDNLSFAINRVSYAKSDDITYYDNPLYGQEVSELSIQYTVNWMSNAAKNGWDGVFSFYNTQDQGKVSVQVAPYVCYNGGGHWMDLNNPNNEGTTNMAPSMAVGKDHVINIRITKNSTQVNVNGEGIGISNVNDGCTNTDLLNYISACDKFTLGVGWAETSFWNTELCSISDLTISAQPVKSNVYIANDGQYSYGSVLKAKMNNSFGAVLSYQWYIGTEENGEYTEIVGETGNKYIPKADDIGKFIKVKAITGETEVESVAVPITKRVLAADASVKDKDYDGTDSAELVSRELIGIVNNDEVTYKAEAKFEDANAGSSKNVVVNFTLDEKWNACYELQENVLHRVAEIFKLMPQYTLPTGLTAVEGQTLKDITLPAGFSFQDALTTSVGEAGTHEFEVVFTPEDATNYKVITGIKVTVTVEKKPDDSGNTGDDNPEENPGGTGGFGGGTISGGTGSAGSSSSTNTENNGGDSTQPDNSGDNNTPSTNPENNVTTETKPDGTVVETTTETAADGTVKETVTETQTDGTVSSTVTETKPDGSKTEKKEVKTSDDTTLLVEAETKADGTSTAKSVIKTGTTGQSGTVEIAESLLQAVAEDDRMDRVAVQITDTTVNSAVTGSKNTVVSVNIPSVEGVDVDVVLNKDSITAAKSSGKGLKVNVANGGTEGYVVTIPAKQLAKISGNVEELNITIAVEKAADVSDASKKDTITNLVTKSKGKTAKTCVVGIAENANVTAGMNVKVPVKETAGNSSQVYIYKYDKKSGKLVEVANSKQKVASDGTVSIAAKEGTDYVVSAKKLSGKNVETIKDGISVSVSKKSVKAGKAVSAKVSLPETVSKKAKFGTEKATIAYKSSNSKVASVSKNGKIKAKKKGTVVITVTVKLSSGQKVTEKRKIKIK